MTSRSIVSVASFALALCFLLPHHAHADKRVVVLEVDGPKGAAFEKAVVGIVKGAHEYISAARFTRAAKKVKRFKPDDDGVRKVATRLKADGVVIGSVAKRKGGRFELTLKLRAGATGEVVGEPISVTVKGAKLKGKDLKRVKAALLAAIDALPAADDADGGAADAGAAVAAGDEPPADEPPAAEAPAAAVEGDGDGADPAAAVEATAEAPASDDDGDLAVRGRAVDVVVGMSFISRDLGFSLSSDVADTPQGYQGSLVPAVYLAAELYPMALGGRGRAVTANLGLTLELERVIAINSKVQGMEEIELPTSQQRFGVGAVYRWNFGSRPTSPTLKLGVAYNKAAFTIDKTDAPAGTDIPNVDYGYLSPGVELRFPFTAALAALAEAHYLFVLSAGEIEEAAQFGPGSTVAFDIDLGAEYRITPRFVARGGFRLSRFAMSFDGTGALTDRDGDGAQDVSSATDRYLGLYAVVGYLF